MFPEYIYFLFWARAFFISTFCITSTLFCANGSAKEPATAERETLIQQLIAEARGSLESDPQIAKGFYAIARLATDHSHPHRQEADTHLDNNPMTSEEIKMAVAAIKYVQTTRSAAAWVGNLFKRS